jgi:WD repeat-containing protein 48
VIDSSQPNGTRSDSITRFRAQTHAHTHWVNDITLAQQHTALVSASSDLLVKVWRPLADDVHEPVTIGQHADYVKCVAAPSQSATWVASGGLDRKIYLWDLSGAGKILEIDVRGEEVPQKGSVYALGVTHNILANGGPESIVRLWDPRSGQRITKFVGHTDMIRAILVSESGDMVLSASADQTVKVWSVTAGRCMHTLTMHDHSVWSLFSDDSGLNVFYSGDRSGLVVKTDVRETKGDLDNGLCVAIAKEAEGVSKIVAWNGSIWMATARASINRWRDVDTDSVQLPEAYRQHRASMMSVKSKDVAPGSPTTIGPDGTKKTIPAKSILRISNTASFPLAIGRDDEHPLPGLLSKNSQPTTQDSSSTVEPIHHLPVETIEGQFGLVKHRLLNDRRRVLTLDTAGDVLMWDLVQVRRRKSSQCEKGLANAFQCRPIQSFGRRRLEDVECEVNTREAVAPWCSIDISSGNLTVVLEPYNCFDAEMYADELVLDEPVEFREDQRSEFFPSRVGRKYADVLQSTLGNGCFVTYSRI